MRLALSITHSYYSEGDWFKESVVPVQALVFQKKKKAHE